MKSKILTIAICLLFALPASLCAATLQTTASWQTALKEKSIFQIADAMTSADQASRWPTIHSKSVSDGSVDPKLSSALQELARSLHQKLRASFSRISPATTKQLLDEVKSYARLSAALQTAGGYDNLLLSDTVNRFLCFRLSQWLESHPQEFSQLEAVVADVPVMRVEIKAQLLAFLNDDPSAREQEQTIRDLDDKLSLHAILQRFASDSKIAFGWMGGAATAESLLDEPNAFALTARMVVTESMFRVHLRSLLEFLAKQGTFDELSPSDIRPFEKRMGASINSYKYPPLGIRYLSVDAPLSLLLLHRDKRTGDVFLNQL
jgi:hypothetical protein